MRIRHSTASVDITLRRGNVIQFLIMAEEIAKKNENAKVVMKCTNGTGKYGRDVLIFDSEKTRFLHGNRTYVKE